MPAADATVDLVHAASMVTLTHFIPAHRRLATTGAAAAFLFAVADPRATVHLTPGPDPEATAATPPGPELRSSHRKEAAPMSSTDRCRLDGQRPRHPRLGAPQRPHDLAVMGGPTNHKQST